MVAPKKHPRSKPCENCGALVHPVMLEQLAHETEASWHYNCAKCGHEAVAGS